MKKYITLFMTLLLMFLFSAALADEPVRIYALQGPTGIGLVPVMDQNDGHYDFELAGAPDAVVAAVVSGNADIACVPTNMAAVLYQKTGGEVRLLALNTLGVLSVLENGQSIQCVQDLAGKTLYATGQGSTPEYVLDYILEAYGLKDQVTVEYLGEHAELATRAATGELDLVMLPEPHVTSVLNRNADFRIALDLTDLFNEAAVLNGEQALLSMGCVIARTAFAEAHPEELEAFLTAYEAAVTAVNGDPHAASLLVEQFGVMPNAAVAEKAIPNCHIVFIRGEEMRTRIAPFFSVLYRANPASIGGALPDDDLYYE